MTTSPLHLLDNKNQYQYKLHITLEARSMNFKRRFKGYPVNILEINIKMVLYLPFFLFLKELISQLLKYKYKAKVKLSLCLIN
jgi:hypothetical protein